MPLLPSVELSIIAADAILFVSKQKASTSAITHMAKFAIKGYEVDAAGFLLKPLSYTEFALKMDKIVPRLNRRETDTLCVKMDIGMAKIYISDIFYVKVEGRYVSLHTHGNIIPLHKSMKEVETLLERYKFVCCDNSYLVNLAHVSFIGKNTAIVAGEEIPVSRAKRKKFLDALTVYKRRPDKFFEQRLVGSSDTKFFQRIDDGI